MKNTTVAVMKTYINIQMMHSCNHICVSVSTKLEIYLSLLFITFCSLLWIGWRKSLMVVQPDTVIRWHKRGFRLYLRWKSRPRWRGRRKVNKENRDLIRNMSRANSLWSAPLLPYSTSPSKAWFSVRMTLMEGISTTALSPARMHLSK